MTRLPRSATCTRAVAPPADAAAVSGRADGLAAAVSWAAWDTASVHARQERGTIALVVCLRYLSKTFRLATGPPPYLAAFAVLTASAAAARRYSPPPAAAASHSPSVLVPRLPQSSSLTDAKLCRAHEARAKLSSAEGKRSWLDRPPAARSPTCVRHTSRAGCLAQCNTVCLENGCAAIASKPKTESSCHCA